MGIRRITSFFNINKFRSAFEPIIIELSKSNLVPLQQKATELGRKNPWIWKVVSAFSYYPDDLGNEIVEFDDDESRIQFWIYLIIANFCETVDKPLNAREIVEVLKMFNIDREVSEELAIGRPLGGLLLPQIEKRTALERKESDWPYWCNNYGGIGWLDYEDILSILNLLSNNKRYLAVKTSINLVDQEKLSKYDALLKMLMEAAENRSGLFLGVSV